MPEDWALTPSGLRPGEKFRLLFATSTTRNAQSSNIADYNTFVQNRAAAGHSAIRRYSSQFRVVGSTSTVDARDNTGTTGTGVPIYWLDGNKLADNYPDFYDGSWDDHGMRSENGVTGGIFSFWTGSNDDGTKNAFPLGGALVRVGRRELPSDSPLSDASGSPGFLYRLYALSPVFKVYEPPPAELSLIWTETIPPRPQSMNPSLTGRKVGKEVSETDSGTTDVYFYVRTERLHSSKLPFRVCVTGDATQSTTNSPQKEVEDDFQVVVDNAVQGASCFDTSIPANQQYKRMTIRILNDDRFEGSDGEQVRIALTQAPGNPLPSPYGIRAAYNLLHLRIADDDFYQQPVQFSPAEYEIVHGSAVLGRAQTRRVKEGSNSGHVGLMFTKGVPYAPYTVTYKHPCLGSSTELPVNWC